MDEHAQNDVSPLDAPLPMQPHNCTAVIEALVARTPDDAWEEIAP